MFSLRLYTVGKFYLNIVQALRQNLTVNNVVKYLDQHLVSEQWLLVASELKLPKYVIRSIQSSKYHNNLTSLRKVVEWWFQVENNPEWSAIREVVQKIRQVAQGILIVIGTGDYNISLVTLSRLKRTCMYMTRVPFTCVTHCAEFHN